MRHSPNFLRQVAAILLPGMLLAALLTFYWLVITTQISLPAGADYTKFYFAAYQALHGQPIYAVMDPALFGIPAEEFFRSPLVLNPPLNMPLVTAAYMPLALLPFAPSFWVWTVLSVAAALIACVLLWRVLYGPQARLRTLLWMSVALLASFPAFTALRLGQTTMVMFLLVTIGWAAARRGRNSWAGIAIGLAAGLRTFAALLLLYFLIKRQWRLLLCSCATFALTVLLSLPFVGLNAYGEWLAVLGGMDWEGRNWNGSLSGFFARLLPPGPALLLTAACSLLLLGLLAWLSWPQATQADSRTDSRTDDLTYSLALALMLLLSPLGWMYYFPILYAGVFIVWRATDRGPLRRLRWALLPCWLLSNIPTVQHQASELTDPLGWWTWNSAYFYALLIFTALLTYLAARSKTEGRGA